MSEPSEDREAGSKDEGLIDTPVGRSMQDRIAQNALASPPLPENSGQPRSLWSAVVDGLGKLWNAPNTLIGLAYGGLGVVVGEVGHGLGMQRIRPRMFLRDNAVQFTHNPFGGVGALTLGNTTTWHGDPYDPASNYWHTNGVPDLENGHTYPQHETAHTYQGQALGPLYLPSNLLGLAAGVLLDRKAPIPSHGPHNWNEVGPQMNPPRPWPRRDLQ